MNLIEVVRPMFGYVRPLKPMMRFHEFDEYKAVYCGLCAKLGKRYGLISRFTLNYDFVFLAMVALSVREEEPVYTKCRCVANPFCKKDCTADSEALELAAGSAMILAFYKIKDDLHDRGLGKKIAAAAMYPFLRGAHKKAAERYPEIDSAVADAMTRQSKLEAENCDSVDRAADPTASFLGAVFEGLSQSKDRRRVLHRFGYLLGRWIYLIDAFDDLPDDLKKKNYNPLIHRYSLSHREDYDREKIGGEILEILNFTVSELSAAYTLMDIHHYKDILDNILYLGLPKTQEAIFHTQKGEE